MVTGRLEDALGSAMTGRPRQGSGAGHRAPGTVRELWWERMAERAGRGPGAEAGQPRESVFTRGRAAWRRAQEGVFVDLLERPHNPRHT